MAELITQVQAALVDRYTIEGEVGRGGMGVVYRAWDVKHARRVALKVVRPELGSVLADERFEREIRLAAQLQHPHIVPLYDSGKANDSLYYVMPYVEGEALSTRLARERQLALEDALQITGEVAEALSYAHRQNVLHRDIKPENILLSRGHALVLDFGIGRAITVAGGDRLTESGFSVGTPAYMSPEQATGDPQLDGRSDLYSLACVLYEMLAGHPPFLGATAQEVIVRHTLDAVPSLRSARPGVPPAVERVVTKALAKVPADRFATASAFAAALEEARTAPPEPEAAAVRRVSRRTAVWIGGGALTAAAAVLGLVKLRHQPPTVFVPGRVVVAPLESPAGDSALSEFARGLAATLPEAIAREGVAEPVPDATAGDVLAHATGLPGVVAERLARETGAGLELRGRCARVPGGTTCEVDVLRMPAKVLRMSVGATGDPTQPAFEAELTERVLVALLLQRTYGDRVTWLGEYVPHSLAALRAFESGWDLQWGNDSSPDPYYVEAARLDTAWVLPAALHVYYTHDTASLKRLANRPGLIAGQRETAELILAQIRGDPERSFELAQRRFAVNPEWSLFVVTYWAYATGRANTALAVSGYVDSAVHVPDRALRRTEAMRGFVLHQLGRYHDELRLARDLERRFPDNQLQERTNEVMALAALGEVDSLRRRLAEWAAIPEGKGWMGTRAVAAGEELMAHGKEREGRELLATALPLLRRMRKTEGYCTCEEVAILQSTDQLDEADRLGRADLRTVKSMADSDGYLGELGVIAARRGRPEEAAQYDRLLARAQQRPGLTGEILYQRALIASAVGDREEAVRLLEEARARGQWEALYVPVHRDPGFIPLRGYPPFERFLKPRG